MTFLCQPHGSAMRADQLAALTYIPRFQTFTYLGYLQARGYRLPSCFGLVGYLSCRILFLQGYGICKRHLFYTQQIGDHLDQDLKATTSRTLFSSAQKHAVKRRLDVVEL